MAKNIENEVDDDLDDDEKPEVGKSTEKDGKDGLKEASKAEGDDPDDEKPAKSALEQAVEHEEEAQQADEAGPEAAELEKRREKKRAERKARKVAAREFKEAQARENQALKRRVEQLEQGQQHIHKRTTGHEIGQLDRAIGEVGQQYSAFKAKRKAAMEAGDAAAFEEADEGMQKCLIGHQRLANVKQRLTQAAQQTGRQENPSARRLGTEWLAKRSWYQPDGDGEDTLVARVIDEKLADEGTYDPGTPEYWAELDRRLARRLPHRYGKQQAADQDLIDDDGDDNVDDDPKPKNNRGGPPTGGSGRDAGSNRRTDNLSAARVQALKDAGHWDDPKQRAKMIKKYENYDRLTAAQGR